MIHKDWTFQGIRYVGTGDLSSRNIEWCKLREKHMSDIAEAVAAEREACAALIEKASEDCGGHGEPRCQTPSE